MLGEKDAVTQQYEREIRIGMILLGVLCVAFVGVLARRIWVENRQQGAANKKPVYLTKAQRDDLRVKNKPHSLAALNASTPMRRLRSTKDAEAKLENSTAGQAEAEVPDLSIGDDTSEAPKSQPANYLQQSEADSATDSAQEIEPTQEPEREREKELEKATEKESETVPEAAPIKSAPLKPAPRANLESPKSEIDFAPTENRDASSNVDETTRPGEIAPTEAANSDDVASKRGSRFSDPLPGEKKPEEKTTEEPETEEPTPETTPEPALRPISKINPPALSESRQPISDTPTEAAIENPGEKGNAMPSAAPEVVRKKVDKNPWKRPATSAPKQHHPHYTVQTGDTLKSIAQEILSDETRWQEIYDLNRAEIGDDYSYLRKGLRLKLPKAIDTPPELADPRASSAKIEPQSVLKK